MPRRNYPNSNYYGNNGITATILSPNRDTLISEIYELQDIELRLLGREYIDKKSDYRFLPNSFLIDLRNKYINRLSVHDDAYKWLLIANNPPTYVESLDVLGVPSNNNDVDIRRRRRKRVESHTEVINSSGKESSNVDTTAYASNNRESSELGSMYTSQQGEPGFSKAIVSQALPNKDKSNIKATVSQALPNKDKSNIKATVSQALPNKDRSNTNNLVTTARAAQALAEGESNKGQPDNNNTGRNSYSRESDSSNEDNPNAYLPSAKKRKSNFYDAPSDNLNKNNSNPGLPPAKKRKSNPSDAPSDNLNTDSYNPGLSPAKKRRNNPSDVPSDNLNTDSYNPGLSSAKKRRNNPSDAPSDDLNIDYYNGYLAPDKKGKFSTCFTRGLTEEESEHDLQYIKRTIEKQGFKQTNNSSKASNPLDQFEIKNYISVEAPILHISLTNIGLYLTIAALIVLVLNLIANNYKKVVTNNWSLSQDSIYLTILNIVINQISANKGGQLFHPFIYVLFIYIIISNLIGMIPYSFASTSHFILTFSMSFTVVLGATILGFNKYALIFFSLLVPTGCPLELLPLLVLIEFISYLARNVSLGLRLAANILSGHMLLNILSGFTYKILTRGLIFFLLAVIPLVFIIAFSNLELGISFIQAQVYVVLSSSYIKDALFVH